MRSILIAPSILTADFGRLEEAARAGGAAGVDLWHLDVMDGHFVPAITFGASVVEVFRRASTLPIEVHLMVANPADQLRPFAEAGAQRLMFHYEATTEPHALLEATRALGCERGIAISPETPVSALEGLLADLEQVTVMLIHPGRGGQPMMPELLEKVRDLRARIDAAGLATHIEVDGGVKATNIASCLAAGAHIAVAGSAVYNEAQTPAEAVAALDAALAAE
ncbi:MAG: ribulose-phosphate 3-epimerase [Dehalococcoidia bacterium]|nr:ribulose-phosphate 3-epimerase [Dehalococcoidia bacterium]